MPSTSKKDYYRILEVHPEASQEVMNKAYKTLVQKFHPDRYHVTNKSVMEEKMREINEAYEVLSDPKLRENYDRHYEAILASGNSGAPVKQNKGRIVKWFLIGAFLTLFLGSGLKLLLLHPVVRIALVVAGVIYGVRAFGNRVS